MAPLIQEERVNLLSYICTPDDQDYFAVLLEPKENLEVTLHDLPADYDLVLIGPDGGTAGASFASGTEEEHVFIPNAVAGLYYIKVVSAEGAYSAELPYVLSIAVTGYQAPTPTPAPTFTPVPTPTPVPTIGPPPLIVVTHSGALNARLDPSAADVWHNEIVPLLDRRYPGWVGMNLAATYSSMPDAEESQRQKAAFQVGQAQGVTVVYSLACYGAHIVQHWDARQGMWVAKTPQNSIALHFLDTGTLAFIGNTDIGYDRWSGCGKRVLGVCVWPNPVDKEKNLGVGAGLMADYFLQEMSAYGTHPFWAYYRAKRHYGGELQLVAIGSEQGDKYNIRWKTQLQQVYFGAPPAYAR
ncbi:MAG: PPC domain-containing protein [Anaerolineae bacterium]